MRPSYITAIRSASEKISSSSVETMITAVPRSRSSMIRLWMNSIEPTSTPRVGWEAISTFSVRENSRATTTFCWLPPDSELRLLRVDSVRMSNSLDPLASAFAAISSSLSD